MTQATQHGINAYQNQHQGLMTDREIDARALVLCADELQVAIDGLGKDIKVYTAAIRKNQRLWTIFQVALSDPENPLAVDLKITLLNLSRYVDKVSFRAISEYLPDQLKSLLEINRIIAEGLIRKPPVQQSAMQSSMVAPPQSAEATQTSIITSA